MERRLVPAAHVVAVCGVENLAAALLADPCPRLLFPDLEDRAIVAVAVVDIRFIPRFETLEATHQRVLRSDDGGAENAVAMGFETAADELDELVRAAETGGRRVDRQKRAAVLDITEQRLEAGRFHGLVLFPVSVHQYAVEAVEHVAAEVVEVLGVGEIDAIHAKRFFDDAVALDRVVAGVIRGGRAEEQDVDVARLAGGRFGGL